MSELSRRDSAWGCTSLDLSVLDLVTGKPLCAWFFLSG